MLNKMMLKDLYPILNSKIFSKHKYDNLIWLIWVHCYVLAFSNTKFLHEHDLFVITHHFVSKYVHCVSIEFISVISVLVEFCWNYIFGNSMMTPTPVPPLLQGCKPCINAFFITIYLRHTIIVWLYTMSHQICISGTNNIFPIIRRGGLLFECFVIWLWHWTCFGHFLADKGLLTMHFMIHLF